MREAQRPKLPVPAQDYSKATVEAEIRTCPKCGATARNGDFYCRRDGEKLSKQCFACGAPQDPTDDYCWRCGIKAGEQRAQEQAQAEEVLLRLRRMAQERGLLKETAVPG